jgi:alanyl-tRNA synthetase
MEWTSRKVRAQFLDFFESKGHTIVPSAPMVIKDDPTLMFTNAGMNQFKDYFLGNNTPKSTRATDSQKCLRVSGKHNDLEEVGIDTYHHTMFEMLGNWSFGDYFKKEAIEWAWELLTEVYKVDKDRLYVSIFEGDKSDGLSKDQEAFDIWKGLIAEDRILGFDKKDNFWEMGETGPCGPCSEIHVDIRSDEERKLTDGKTLVNADHPQVIEVWNLVFMEFNRFADGSLKPLPNKHIDTGLGFERLSMVLQNVTSNYDTDVFQPLIKKIVEMSGIAYKATDGKTDVATRVISDHVRAIAFSIADGQLPSNTGAGYVIRRILRRAVRYGYSHLDFETSFMYELVAVMVGQMGDQFPELKKQENLITKVIKEEEESFLRTLAKGISRFEDYIAKSKDKSVEGKFAFDLYDTFGFPIDLTQLMASENGMHVDMMEFVRNLEEQKDRSRKATSVSAGDWTEIIFDANEEFVGYDYLTSDIKISRYREADVKGKKQFQLVFNHTPFYPEGGGQVGDVGYIDCDGEKVSIVDTKKENDLIIHITEELPTDPFGDFKAVVNQKERLASACNHSATHLLHEALREVLGSHVEQKGSLVSPVHLRFDFSHFQKVTKEDLEQVETIVNLKIRENIALDEKRSTPIEEAKKLGAIALFGEKYGDVVRVIKFGSSVELCGGTHVASTGQIGLMKFTSEGAVAAGIRRVEAITYEKADQFVKEQIDTLNKVKEVLKNPKNIIQSINELQKKNAELTKKLEVLNKDQAKNKKADLLNGMELINGVNFIGQHVDLDISSIKDLAFQLKSEVDNLFMILGAAGDDKATISIVISDELSKAKNLHAGNIIRELAKEIGGGGGGQPFFATAGGKNAAGISSAIEKAKELLG